MLQRHPSFSSARVGGNPGHAMQGPPGVSRRSVGYFAIVGKSDCSSVVPFFVPFYFRSGSMHPGLSLAGLFTIVLTGYATMSSDG